MSVTEKISILWEEEINSKRTEYSITSGRDREKWSKQWLAILEYRYDSNTVENEPDSWN